MLTSAISLALWAIAVGIIIFGCASFWLTSRLSLTLRRMCAICFQSSGLVEAFFWTQPAHWVLDLASTIVLLVFTYRKKDTLAQASCVNNPSHQICLDLFNGRLIMLTCGLCLYKIIGICKSAIHSHSIKYTNLYCRRLVSSFPAQEILDRSGAAKHNITVA